LCRFFPRRDRIVTPVNVWANCTALVIIEHYSKDELQSLSDVEKPRDFESDANDVASLSSDKDTVTIDVSEEEEEETKTEKNKDVAISLET
jgi:hypothetical protein